MLRSRSLLKFGSLLCSCFCMEVIASLASPDNSPACSLSFKDYPYEPVGECLNNNYEVKQWGMITTNRCCRPALDALSAALARHAHDNDTLYLNKTQWHQCGLAFPKSDPVPIDSCSFSDLYQGDSPCSTLTISDLQAAYPKQYDNLVGNCSQFDDPSYDDTCRRCTQEIESAKTLLMGQLLLNEGDEFNNGICGLALVILVAASKIDDANWLSAFFRCLPAMDVVGGDDYFRIKYPVAKALLAILIAAFGLILIVILIKYVTKKKKPEKPTEGEVKQWSGLYRFSKAEIEQAMSFSYHRESLGAGSAGRVYKGVLPSGQPVAIKHIYKSSKSDTFTREVEGLSRIRHPNLVCLFGCCVEDGERYLVYEYCPYGNLAQHLLRSDSVLSWDKRVKILRDSALALRFLHSYPDGCIVHRDIKLTNILLTENLEPKLSDFGLAKMLGMEESKVFTDVRGTIGYMDPEYMTNAKLTCSSDVYSFGIVSLQILSGKRVIELDIDARDHLTRKAKDVIHGKRPFSDFEDPRLNGNLNVEDFKSILEVAVLCVAGSSKGRPTIHVVFNELDKAWKNTVSNMTARVKSECNLSTTPLRSTELVEV